MVIKHGDNYSTSCFNCIQHFMYLIQAYLAEIVLSFSIIHSNGNFNAYSI